MKKYIGLIVVIHLAVSACGGTGPEGGNCDGVPKSQVLNGPCCLAYGVDACGANSFCAAFDGRTQAVCYPEYSQQDLAECSSDNHCASHECNTAQSKCKSLETFACETTVGCSSYPTGRTLGCEPTTKVCVDITNGQAGDFCESGSCATGLECENSVCKGSAGAGCSSPSDCASKICQYGTCAECEKNADCPNGEYCGSNYTCYEECNTDDHCPKYFRCVPGTLTGSGINQCIENAQCSTDADCSSNGKCKMPNPCTPGAYCRDPTACFAN